MSNIPGSVEITTESCDAPPVSGGCVTACDNPLYRFDNPDTCGALAFASLRIEAAASEVVKGRRTKVRVIARFANGREADVTEESTITSDDTDVAVYEESGIFYGASAGLAGVAGVWKGRAAEATLTVVDSPCVLAQPWDVVFVIDTAVGYYMLQTVQHSLWGGSPQMYWRRGQPGDPNDVVAIDLFDDMVLQTQLAMDLLDDRNPASTGTDRIAVINMNGSANPQITQTWTNEVVEVPVYQTGGVSQLGRALERAENLLATARSSARRLVIVLTMGGTELSPSALTVGNRIRNAGTQLAVVTPLDATSTSKSIPAFPKTAYAYLQALAGPCLFFGGAHYAYAPAILARVIRSACECTTSGSGVGAEIL